MKKIYMQIRCLAIALAFNSDEVTLVNVYIFKNRMGFGQMVWFIIIVKFKKGEVVYGCNDNLLVNWMYLVVHVTEC